MDTSRISFGEIVAAASGLALFVFMFLPWYGVSVEALPSVSGLPSMSAWDAFDFIDMVLLLVAGVAIAAAALRAADAMPSLPAPAGTIVMGAGLLAVALIAFRILVTPDPGGPLVIVEVDSTRRIGLFLGLVAAAGVAYGGYRQTQEVGGAAAPPRTGAEPAAGTGPDAATTAGTGAERGTGGGPTPASTDPDVPADRPGQPAPPSGPESQGGPPPGSSS